MVLLLVACGQQDEVIGEGGSSGAVHLDAQSVPAPVFHAVDQDGQAFNSASLSGTPWVASFFFTSCQTVCPELNTIKSELHTEFGDRIKFVSISTDPENDSVEKLHEYAASFGATAGTWWMVRMPQDSMRQLAQDGFHVMDPSEPSMHSTRLVAVTANMTIAGYFDSAESKDMEALHVWMSSQQ